MVTMDSAARAIDALLHRGRAEERDGGVWLDDLAAQEIGEEASLIVLADYPETIRELKQEIKCLESDLKQSRKAVKKAQKHEGEALRRLRAIQRVVDGRGRMSDKLAAVRDVLSGREDVLGP